MTDSDTFQTSRSNDEIIPVAVLVHPEHCVVDDLLANFALSLQTRGYKIMGVIQQRRGGTGRQYSGRS